MAWNERIAGCFGIKDLIFAGHPLDEKRAKEMVKNAKEEGASRREVLDAIEKYLKGEGASKEHIAAQLKRADKKIGKKLPS
jgi:hypothetical protein